MADLLIVVSCPQCGADVTWLQAEANQHGLLAATVGACTECDYEFFVRVELGYLRGQGMGRGSMTRRKTARCVHCDTEFETHYVNGQRSHKPRITCSNECHSALLRERSGWRNGLEQLNGGHPGTLAHTGRKISA